MKKKLALLLALVMALVVLAGCAGNKNNEEGDITLTWYARINKEADSGEVFAEASKMVKEKMGVNLDIIALEDYDTKIGVINASGEEFDIVFTSSDVNNIYRNVSDGNLLALDSLLPKHAPTLWKEGGESVWEGVKIDGKIYGVPNQQIFARAPGFLIPTQNISVMGLDLENNKYETLADYEGYIKKIKEMTGSYAYVSEAWGGDGAQREGFELILGSNLPGAIRYNKENAVVENQYESQEFKDYINLRRRWVQEGLTAPMEVGVTDLTKYLTTKDKVMPWLIPLATYKPGVEAEYVKNYDLDVTVSTKTAPLMTSRSLVATMAGVNSDTRYPEKSVEFLQLINTDADLYNLITYGIEGKHYTKTGKNSIERSKDHPYAQPAWAIGNTFNGFVMTGQAEDMHEQTKEINATAVNSPILGFAANQDEIAIQIANCRAVLEEYLTVLDMGLADVETTYSAFIEKLKVAGVDTIIENLNKQLADWKANR